MGGPGTNKTLHTLKRAAGWAIVGTAALYLSVTFAATLTGRAAKPPVPAAEAAVRPVPYDMGGGVVCYVLGNCLSCVRR